MIHVSNTLALFHVCGNCEGNVACSHRRSISTRPKNYSVNGDKNSIC